MKINTLIYVTCIILAFVGFIVLIVDICFVNVETFNFGPMLIIEAISLMISFVTMILDDTGEAIGKILNKNIF